MELHPGRFSGLAPEAKPNAHRPLPGYEALSALVLGEALLLPLPPVAELTAALTSLARGQRDKALVPCVESATELALLRRGDHVLVSCYGTDSAPEVHLLDRSVALESALVAAARATEEAAAHERDPIARQIALRMAERATAASARIEPSSVEPAVVKKGGAKESAAEDLPLAFAYEVSLRPTSIEASAAASRADIHALLFDGTLWAFVRGRRVTLSRGPIMLAVQRMVVAVRALVESRDAGRALHLKLRAGGFHIALRSTVGGDVKVTLGGDGDTEVTATAMTVAEAALPILRVTTDLLRTLVAVDRSQGRNLRVRALREEVRALRRSVKERRPQGFLNDDADRLRLEMPAGASDEARPAARAPSRPVTARSLRFGERWRVAMDGLDAAATYLCGDRLVAATAHHTVALSRDQGEVLWARDGEGTSTLLAGSSLLRISPDGTVELCDVRDGEPYATTRLAPRIGPSQALTVGGPSLPPMAIVAEGSHRLVALDLRTGEPRWRFASRGGGAFEISRAGRILLVASGEVELWRHASDARFPFEIAVAGETAVAVSMGGADGAGALHGIDLFSGETKYHVALDEAPLGPPIAAGARVLVPTSNGASAELRAYDAETGAPRWSAPDPGVAAGAAALELDDVLVVNSPGGRLSALEIATGHERWALTLADPLADDVPRKLTPLLRGGALFVPSASVHIVRPHDGERLGTGLPCELVPDAL